MATHKADPLATALVGALASGPAVAELCRAGDDLARY
jgi:hypothetical protein